MQRKNLYRAAAFTVSASIVFGTFSYAAAAVKPGAASVAGIASLYTEEKEFEPIVAPLSSSTWLSNMALSLQKADAEAAETATAETEAESETVDPFYTSLAISKITDGYVNIRSKANTDSDVVGKIYDHAAAQIIETVTADDGEWYKISSGSVEGYIKAEYFVTGAEAQELATQVGYVYATIKPEALRLREEADLTSETITVLSRGETYTIEERGTEFSKISIDGEIEGYVHNDYIDISVEYDKAISIEEEQAKLAEAARLKAEAEAAAKKLAEEEESREEASRKASKSKEAEEESKAKKKETEAEETTKKKETTEEETEKKETKGWQDNGSSSKRDAIVSEALQYYGVLPYVLGGDSLEEGTDCSGFIQQIYMKFGIYLPRVSDEQGYCGEEVSASEMRPGDIVYYGGHVSIYIGDGEVIHCSSPRANPNTRISTWNYRSVISIRNVIGD